MSKTGAFSPADVPETNYTQLPEPLRQQQLKRFNRRLGDHAGLKNFGVVLTRIVPGGQSSFRHAHSHQDEFVYVLEGSPILEANGGEQQMKPGECVGFPAGTGDAHRFLNRTEKDVLLLVVGDRTAGDTASYPDVDLHGVMGPDGRYRFLHKDGTPY